MFSLLPDGAKRQGHLASHVYLHQSHCIPVSSSRTLLQRIENRVVGNTNQIIQLMDNCYRVGTALQKACPIPSAYEDSRKDILWPTEDFANKYSTYLLTTVAGGIFAELPAYLLLRNLYVARYQVFIVFTYSQLSFDGLPSIYCMHVFLPEL